MINIGSTINLLLTTCTRQLYTRFRLPPFLRWVNLRQQLFKHLDSLHHEDCQFVGLEPATVSIRSSIELRIAWRKY